MHLYRYWFHLVIWKTQTKQIVIEKLSRSSQVYSVLTYVYMYTDICEVYMYVGWKTCFEFFQGNKIKSVKSHSKIVL